MLDFLSYSKKTFHGAHFREYIGPKMFFWLNLEALRSFSYSGFKDETATNVYEETESACSSLTTVPSQHKAKLLVSLLFLP